MLFSLIKTTEFKLSDCPVTSTVWDCTLFQIETNVSPSSGLELLSSVQFMMKFSHFLSIRNILEIKVGIAYMSLPVYRSISKFWSKLKSNWTLPRELVCMLWFVYYSRFVPLFDAADKTFKILKIMSPKCPN